MPESCGRHREEAGSSWARRLLRVDRSRDCWFVATYVFSPGPCSAGLARVQMWRRTRSRHPVPTELGSGSEFKGQVEARQSSATTHAREIVNGRGALRDQTK